MAADQEVIRVNGIDLTERDKTIEALRAVGARLVNACDDDDWEYHWVRGHYDALIAEFRVLLAEEKL